MFVYNPCEKLSSFIFASEECQLPTKAVTKLSREAASHVVDVYGKFGVCIVPDVDAPAARKAADEVWKTATRAWAEEKYVQYVERNKAKRDAGILPPEPVGEEADAVDWLKRHNFMPL
jgi:hypothetical protein